MDKITGRIEIIDELGRKVKKYKIENSMQKEIDISKLSSGVYFVKAIDTNQNIVYKSKSFVIDNGKN